MPWKVASVRSERRTVPFFARIPSGSRAHSVTQIDGVRRYPKIVCVKAASRFPSAPRGGSGASNRLSVTVSPRQAPAAKIAAPKEWCRPALGKKNRQSSITRSLQFTTLSPIELRNAVSSAGATMALLELIQVLNQLGWNAAHPRVNVSPRNVRSFASVAMIRLADEEVPSPPPSANRASSRAPRPSIVRPECWKPSRIGACRT